MAQSQEQHADENGYRLNGVTVMLLQVSRVCGAAPVIFERQRSLHIARVSRKYASVAGVVVVFVGNYLLVLSLFCKVLPSLIPSQSAIMLAAPFFEVNSELTKKSHPEHVVAALMIRCVNYLVTSVVFIVAVFGGVGRIRRFMFYYSHIQEIQKGIQNNAMAKTLEKVLVVMLAGSLSIVFIECITNIVFIVLETLHIQRNLIVYVIYASMYIVHVILSLLAMQITFLVTPVLWTLKCLNKSITRSEARILYDGANRDNISTVIDTIRRFSCTYASIVNICSQITATEGFTMLLILFDCTFRILIFAFYTTSATNLDSRFRMYTQIAGQVLHCLRVGCHVVMLVEPCHRTHEELKKTQVLISQLLCAPPSAQDGVSVALARFYEATEPCGYVYTPLGTFKFSRSLYAALIGGLITLLIINADI